MNCISFLRGAPQRAQHKLNASYSDLPAQRMCIPSSNLRWARIQSGKVLNELHVVGVIRMLLEKSLDTLRAELRVLLFWFRSTQT